MAKESASQKVPVRGVPETELEWLDWVRRCNGRIVFVENRDCKQVCKVRTDRFFEKEAETFVEAAKMSFEYYQKIKDPRGNYMRFQD